MSQPLKTIGVIGAGTMGQGIAQVFASGGMEVLLYDAVPSALEKAKTKIGDGLSQLVAKGKMNEAVQRVVMDRIRPVTGLDQVRGDLIIEAVVEDLKVKQDLFRSLENSNSERTIFCTNTSSLSVTEIFNHCEHHGRCLGVHFFNPAPIMKLVELISCEKTDVKVLNLVADLLKDFGKITVISKDSPGFIVNRVARHYYLESLKLLEEGTATKEIDELLKASGFKMGPFELMDLIGIDVNLAVSTAVYNGFKQNAKYKPSTIQIQKVKEGNLGRKTGKGFYDYTAKK